MKNEERKENQDAMQKGNIQRLKIRIIYGIKPNVFLSIEYRHYKGIGTGDSRKQQ